jgi:glycosyltransferase involved in cell wall biosynthesis
MKLMKKNHWKQPTVLWVIGGAMGENTVNGTFASDVIDYMDWILVESKIMVEQLNSVGVDHVLHVPNFKPINYYPNIEERLKSREDGRKIEFVFLSRIMPEKGCDYILQSAHILNDLGYESRFHISFYGKIAPLYEESFRKSLSSLRNVSYKGFLNLREISGLNELGSYDVMLFPTYWKGEGFAGIFMDSFICGVPMIVSDWAHNRQFMEENKTAMFIPVHDVPALTEQMKKCIDGDVDLSAMSIACQKTAPMYDIDNVVTMHLLKKIGLMS